MDLKIVVYILCAIGIIWGTIAFSLFIVTGAVFPMNFIVANDFSNHFVAPDGWQVSKISGMTAAPKGGDWWEIYVKINIPGKEYCWANAIVSYNYNTKEIINLTNFFLDQDCTR